MSKEYEITEEERDGFNRECLVVAREEIDIEGYEVDIKSVFKAYSAVNKKQKEIKKRLREREGRDDIYLYIDAHSICASALYAAINDVDIEEVEPYCVGSQPFLAFAKVAVCLDHMCTITSLVETDDEELFGGQEADDVLKVCK